VFPTDGQTELLYQRHALHIFACGRDA